MSRDGGIVMQPKHKKQLLSFGKTAVKRNDQGRTAPNEVGRNFCGVCAYIDAAIKQSLSQLR